MATVEVITNPTAGIGMILVVLISATALAFLLVLFLCGLDMHELEGAEE